MRIRDLRREAEGGLEEEERERDDAQQHQFLIDALDDLEDVLAAVLGIVVELVCEDLDDDGQHDDGDDHQLDMLAVGRVVAAVLVRARVGVHAPTAAARGAAAAAREHPVLFAVRREAAARGEEHRVPGGAHARERAEERALIGWRELIER